MIYEQLGHNGRSQPAFQGDYFPVIKNSGKRFFTRISEKNQAIKENKFADQTIFFAH